MHIKDTNSGTVITTSPQDMPKRSWRTFLIGQPLPTADAPHQAIGKLIFESPYRLFLDPVLEYISRLEDQLGADEVITELSYQVK